MEQTKGQGLRFYNKSDYTTTKWKSFFFVVFLINFENIEHAMHKFVERPKHMGVTSSSDAQKVVKKKSLASQIIIGYVFLQKDVEKLGVIPGCWAASGNAAAGKGLLLILLEERTSDDIADIARARAMLERPLAFDARRCRRLAIGGRAADSTCTHVGKGKKNNHGNQTL